MSTPNHPHGGHRKRMRQRLIANGSDGFQKHELLEMALFATIPQGNTNDIAHRLLDRFGSISEVMDAPTQELVKIEGVGDTSAMLLKLIPIFARIYQEEKFEAKYQKPKINATKIACEFLKAKYVDKVFELASVMLLDNSCRLIGWVPIGSGSMNNTHIDVRSLVEACINYKATGAILCHNHPSGIALPSVDDITATKQAIQVLEAIGVELHDHVIVAANDCVSLADSEKYAILFSKNNRQQ